jgi:hypothetical protein
LFKSQKLRADAAGSNRTSGYPAGSAAAISRRARRDLPAATHRLTPNSVVATGPGAFEDQRGHCAELLISLRRNPRCRCRTGQWPPRTRREPEERVHVRAECLRRGAYFGHQSPRQPAFISSLRQGAIWVPPRCPFQVAFFRRWQAPDQCLRGRAC